METWRNLTLQEQQHWDHCRGKRKRGNLRAVLALVTPEQQQVSGSSPQLLGESCTCREFPSAGGSGTSLSQAEIQVGFWLLLHGPISLPESSNFQIWAFARLSWLIRRGLQELNSSLQSRDSISPPVLSSFNPSFCITEPVLIVLL